MYFTNYDKFPTIKVSGKGMFAWSGNSNVKKFFKSVDCGSEKRKIVVIDCYPGVNVEEMFCNLFEKGDYVLAIKSDDCAKPIAEIDDMIDRNLTDDRVFGVMSFRTLDEFFDKTKIASVRREIENVKSGVVIVYGVGASLITDGDLLVYCDLARWEIQQRYRRGMPNWLCNNGSEDTLRKYKRGFFIEWRVADRHKLALFDKIDFFLDTTESDYKLMSGKTVRTGIEQTVKRPFRVVPFFDPGVWGGQWMKKYCGLDPVEKNYAWCFDCVPEENSLLLEYDGVVVEIPAIDVVLTRPIELLGDKVHARFGTEFPIRFDFLDTMDGQNLSLQVHPLTEYIQNVFGMHYTQDESYYILDAKNDACVYLGVKNGTKKEDLIDALEESQETGKFDDERFINCFSAKKHDHFLIPAGTIHCSGKNTMVLEISATPYIFTFKLWDWNRLGLDGKPRPIHIAHGKHNIRIERNTDWVKQNLINRIEIVSDEKGCIEEKTGLHEREFIETRRHWFDSPIIIDGNGGVQVLNLVEGREAVVESVDGSFLPFTVHYAETFIIPAAVSTVRVIPKDEKCGLIRAFVRV